MSKVVVTTIHRGVFFGELAEENGDSCKLKNARNCVYWAPSVRGFLGLAASGPTKGSRVGPSVPALTLRGVTSITECSDDAVAAWKAGPWTA